MNNIILQSNSPDIYLVVDHRDILHIKIATHQFNDPVELNEDELEDLLNKLSEALVLIKEQAQT